MKKLIPIIVLLVAVIFVLTKNDKAIVADQYMKNTTLRMDGPAKYAAMHSLIRTTNGQEVPAYKNGDLVREFNNAVSASSSRTPQTLEWIERGPANVGGRTRGIIVDTRDMSAHTWVVGSAGGGVWRTRDAAQTWTLLTPDLPNLAASTIASSPNNPDVIYVGTGEAFGNIDGITGSGIWKSVDDGATWEALDATIKNSAFADIARIIVNPQNENELLACAVGEFENGQRLSYIHKSTDGGENWTTTYTTNQGRVQQLIFHESDFSVIYASVNSVGVLRSTDTGETWNSVFNAGPNQVQRIEMAISPADVGVIYLSCESRGGSSLFYTRDTFNSVQSTVYNGQQANWLSGQGWYDNTIAVHPYDDRKVWVAGAGAMLEIIPGTELDTVKLFDRFINETDYLIDIDNSPFSDESAGLARDLYEGLPINPQTTLDDLVDVNILFGPGRSQKAHLISVDLYNYGFEFESMIDVPFEAWDTVNNRQVSLSVFDVDANNIWTYQDYTELSQPFHDVVNINMITYSDTGDVTIQTTNPLYKAQYYFFMGKDPDYDGDETNFPDGYFSFLTREDEGLVSDFKPITDGYFQYTSIEFVGSKGVHVDHHNIIFIPIDSATESFYLLNANDGGIAFSEDNAETFIQTGETFNDGSFTSSYGYNTSQFYGVDKMNGGNRYIGGTQDNGTWISPMDPDATTNWVGAPSGDGFEAAWNYGDPNQILESSQFNGLFKSRDGGSSWDNVQLPGGEGPFITRVAASQIETDLVFMVAEEGVLKSNDFGDSWEVIDMPNEWRFNGSWGPPIEVSLASANVVWTGGNMQNNNRLVVSTDQGTTFSATENYTAADMGTVTGIATHPHDSNTAYALFSQANGPKILMTDDMGQTWIDLSGFVVNANESSNGYPDVATYGLLVMPWDTDWMWAATEIGIFETRNGGVSWEIAKNGLPPVAIWEIKIVGDEVVLATHGRGIWTLNIDELNPVGTFNQESNAQASLDVFPNPVIDQAIISYELTKKSAVAISLFSIDGKRVRSIYSGDAQAGNYQIPLNSESLQPGTYLVYLETETGVVTQRIVIH
jgi:photosystem II stability/assembly factor-like uncharacterized protein